jgi:precorrin-2 dehydrogenase/sirohydrochlorin ferrochelatase
MIVKRIKPEPFLTNSADSKTYYPVFLNLRGRKAVVVGGGGIAERKILSLLKAGAEVTVISPDITPKIEKQKSKGCLTHINRRYRNRDLHGAFLVIAATDSLSTNEKVSRDAPCLVNVVDTPHLCNFIVPSAMKRGPLTIAVSTGGVSPALSRSLRMELEKEYSVEFARYLQLLRRVRAEAMEAIPDQKKRSRFLKALASEEMLRTLREEGLKKTGQAVDVLFKRARKAP